jgi:hypothetical protein
MAYTQVTELHTDILLSGKALKYPLLPLLDIYTLVQLPGLTLGWFFTQITISREHLSVLSAGFNKGYF